MSCRYCSISYGTLAECGLRLAESLLVLILVICDRVLARDYPASSLLRTHAKSIACIVLLACGLRIRGGTGLALYMANKLISYVTVQVHRTMLRSFLRVAYHFPLQRTRKIKRASYHGSMLCGGVVFLFFLQVPFALS